MKKKLVLAAIAFAFLGVSATALAQFGLFGGQGGRNAGGYSGQCMVAGSRNGSGEGDTAAPRSINRAGFVYARVRYHIARRWSNEVPWHHDYPDGDTC